MPKPRLVLHAQQFRGTGHRVRMARLAGALARDFEIHLLDGGPPEPRIRLPPGARSVALEPLVRDVGSSMVRPWRDGSELATALDRRRRKAAEVVATTRPAALVFEFYPFSRWLLTPEIEAMIAGARSRRPDALVLSSVRDVLETGFDSESQGGIGDRSALRDRLRSFDAVLVHGEPRVGLWDADLESLVASVSPVVHTGYVAPAVEAAPARTRRAGTVVSVGGGVDGLPLIAAALDAWPALAARPDAERLRPLTVFLGPYVPETEARAVRARCRALDARWAPFSEEFLPTLAGAALSISRGGYNTCADLLATRIPAIVSPTRINDQLRRARYLERLGRLVIAEDSAESIVAAVPRALHLTFDGDSPRLDGADRTAAWIATRLAGDVRFG